MISPIHQMDSQNSILDIVEEFDDNLLLKWCRYFRIDFQLRNVLSFRKDCERTLLDFLIGVLSFKVYDWDFWKASLSCKSLSLGFFSTTHKVKEMDLPIWRKEEVCHLKEKEKHI